MRSFLSLGIVPLGIVLGMTGLPVCQAGEKLPENAFPGGILDSTGRAAYLRTLEGIAAIDLTRGDVLWHRREAQVPLLVVGDRLYALALSAANRLSVMAYDLSGAGASKSREVQSVFQTEVTDLPRWVSTLGGSGKTFQYRWVRQDRLLKLSWMAESQTADTPSPSKAAHGVIKIDLDSGVVRSEMFSGHQPVPALEVPKQVQRMSVRWQGTFGDHLVAVALEELAGSKPELRKQQLVLRGWDIRSGKEAVRRSLVEGHRVILLADADGKHLWARDSGARRGPDETDRPERHHWSVFSAKDGHEVARVPFVPGTTAVTLHENRAYCLAIRGGRIGKDGSVSTQHAVHAIEVPGGKVAWRCDLGR